MTNNAQYNNDQQFEPESYDIKCRICDWKQENVSPTIAGVKMIRHLKDHQAPKQPTFSIRVNTGYLGTDPENPIQTPRDGWNRATSISSSQESVLNANHKNDN